MDRPEIQESTSRVQYKYRYTVTYSQWQRPWLTASQIWFSGLRLEGTGLPDWATMMLFTPSRRPFYTVQCKRKEQDSLLLAFSCWSTAFQMASSTRTP